MIVNPCSILFHINDHKHNLAFIYNAADSIKFVLKLLVAVSPLVSNFQAEGSASQVQKPSRYYEVHNRPMMHFI